MSDDDVVTPSKRRALTREPAERTYLDFVELAEHYIVVGQANIPLLTRNDQDKPWQHVNRIEWGYRLTEIDVAGRTVSVPSSVILVAAHPCGLEFTWSVTLLEVDGLSIPAIDVQRFKDLMKRLLSSSRAGACRVSVHLFVRHVTDEIRRAAMLQRAMAEQYIIACNQNDEALRAIWDA